MERESPSLHLATTADIETRAARIADPAKPLAAKYETAQELKEMIDTVRDSDGPRVFPHMLATLLEIIRSSEPSFKRDSVECNFRKTLIEIIHHIPPSEGVRPHTANMINVLFSVIRDDNEDNGVTCLKTFNESIRSMKLVSDEQVVELAQIFLQLLKNISSVVTELFSDSSQTLDASVIIPSIRSLKVLAEMPMVVMWFISQLQTRNAILPFTKDMNRAVLDVLQVESQTQKSAREDFEAMGGKWAGLAPGIKNPKLYEGLILAQLKLMQFCNFVQRTQTPGTDQDHRRELLPAICVRLLQDCPLHLSSVRKELIHAVRQQLSSSPYKNNFIPVIEKLLDDRIIVGSPTYPPDSTRFGPYVTSLELTAGLRSEYDSSQLVRIFYILGKWLLRASMGYPGQALCMRALMAMLEPVIVKLPNEDGKNICALCFRLSVEKLKTVEMNFKQIHARRRLREGYGESEVVVHFIEEDRPLPSAHAVIETESSIAEVRALHKAATLLCRMSLTGMKKVGAKLPNGETMTPIFRQCISIWSNYDVADFTEEREAMEIFSNIVQEISLHTFQEVWTQQLDFFFRAMVKQPSLIQLTSILFQSKPISQTIVSVTLKYLSDQLETLGNCDENVASTILRFFKAVCNIVSIHPEAVEPVLASHLGRLIMDSFPLAAKSQRPIYYYQLMRILFRAIGSGAGRYDKLYKEVLPLLPEMLDCLTRQLMAAEGQTRELLVELCLTVPLRLTDLLPHLHYLMKPLVMALQGGTELVSQGLRTLELCIDNLISDFLDPILRPVLRDLMEALHSHLKPLPVNHHHAHTTIRILGKLGGRNRRLLDEKYSLSYVAYSDPATLAIAFSGRQQTVQISHMAKVAREMLTKKDSPDHVHAYNYLENTLTYLQNEGLKNHDSETQFVKGVEALFDAIHLPDVQARALEYLRTLSRHVFSIELRRVLNGDLAKRRHPTHIFGLYLDALPSAMARSDEEQAQRGAEVIKELVHDLVPIGRANGLKASDVLPIIHLIANRFTTVSFESDWVKQKAGCTGVMIMTSTPEIGDKFLAVREIDIIRTLMHVLKDSPYDPPRSVLQIKDDLLSILRRTNVPRADGMDVDGEVSQQRSRLPYFATLFFTEVSCAHPGVRQAVHDCLELLASLFNKTVSDLGKLVKDRLHTTIYVKPLRALNHNLVIGLVDAVRYLIGFTPSILDEDEQLIRLLSEALGLAENGDSLLVSKHDIRKSTLEVTQLRVSCLKLLTNALVLTENFSRHPAMRQRVTQVYFKSLYNPSKDVADAAHDGLRIILSDQTRFPKESLQQGLRPILMNLSDTKKLTIQDLDGLSRLLMLLANYFKVEIGQKLLEHFRTIADHQTLLLAARMPLSESDAINKLVRLVNVYHLLPPTASMYLKDLVENVVATEAVLMSCTQSPFSEPLGKYLDRNASEAADFFLARLSSPDFIRTFRNVLNERCAPKLLAEMGSRTQQIVNLALKSDNPQSILSGLMLCKDLANQIDGWIINDEIIEPIRDIWRKEQVSPSDWRKHPFQVFDMYGIILDILMKVLSTTPRIDLILDITLLYTNEVPVDRTHVSHFLYEHIASSRSSQFRRNILLRFQLWFEDSTVTWATKTALLHHVINPIVFVHTSRTSEETIFDKSIVDWLHQKIWSANDTGIITGADDLFKIELLHFTTILIRHCSQLFVGAKKDLIKFIWAYITSEDQTLKQAANLLAAHFFSAYETPPKFIMRTWTGLLQAPHVEGNRALTHQALDILAPVLRSMPPDKNVPHWSRTTRKILAEEGSGLIQIWVIYQLIVRQSDLFYPYRALYIPHIINSLHKLGVHLSPSMDGRIVSLDILEVVWRWEDKSHQIKEGSLMEEGGPVDESADWVTPLAFREAVISFLTRAACSVQDPNARSTGVSRALTLMRNFLRLPAWSDVNFKLDYFRKYLSEAELTKESMPVILATARVLNVVCTDRPDAWFIQNGNMLQKLIQKGMASEESLLHETFYPIVDRLLALFPLPKEEEEAPHPDMAEFHSFVHETITEYLKSPSGIRSSILMLKSVAQHSPERLELYAPALLKLLSKLTKDHANASDFRSPDYDATVRLIIMTLKICQTASSFASEQRKTYLANLLVLIEKSMSPQLCQFLLDMGREWALQRRDAYPTMKEKASLLMKMATFETRGIELFNQFLELIYEIYSESSLRRSELTSRLEPAFMLGCRSVDTSLRERFMDLLDSSIPRSLISRLTYILAVQSWESLADHNWIYLALDLLLSSADAEMPLSSSPSVIFQQTASPMAQTIANSTIRDVVRPMRRLLFHDIQAAHDTWISVFSAVWSLLSRKEQTDVTSHLVVLLSRDYHIRQSELRPNVIQGLLEAIHVCRPAICLPAHLVKYLAKTFCCWHVAMEYLQVSLDTVRDDEPPSRDTTYDALAELYAEIAEEDMFYGLWRRRSMHHETNVAITYEQNGMWPEAQIAYEQAQSKAREGLINFTESEYCLWEDHWITATEKMQQWDILYDLARVDGNNELLLEAAWRSKDWSDKDQLSMLEEQLQQMSAVATPRRRVYEAFISLAKSPGATDKNVEFTRILEDAMQLSLRKWIGFPSKMSSSHIPLLQHFQQFVELQEAVQIFGSLSSTTAQNIERKSSELKLVLQAWRERLPNLHDDISVWSDLVAWRQNVFGSINKHYIPIINASQPNNPPNAASTYGYRGYHETAWIINRFAHVARKHDLFEVAQQSLTKIYELPNIEISEAFLKLREEARCRLQVPERLVDGLNLINNTNLIYFSTPQKAEFYTLKAMFYSALGQTDESDNCFSQAVTLDMNVAKAWAEWGRFNDKLFGSSPSEIKHAAQAVTCYLQAAGLYKNAKSRPLLQRILWLLSLDDSSCAIAQAFQKFAGDRALWYWIHLVPQLLFSLSFQEGSQAFKLLLELARMHPQGVFFPLRTLKEDHSLLRKQADQTRQGKISQGNDADAANAEFTEILKRPEAKYVDDLVAQVKTNNPLLALTLENIVEQFSGRFKATPEEEIYRFTFMLLQDAVQNASHRAGNLSDDGTLSEQLQKNITRLGSHLLGDAKRDFEEDFMVHRPILSEYVSRLQHWRDRYERHLDARPRVQSLDLISHWLMEFQFVKLDEIDVPGQYLELVDGPQQFSRIRRFGPKFEICRGQGYCFKRIVIHGHDGIKFDFAVQQPVARWIRREDRVMQLFRTFNLALTRRKESRKRNLQFHLPLAVSITPQLRLLANDASYVTLQDVYDQHCLDKEMTREDPVLQIAAKTKEIVEQRNSPLNSSENNAIRRAIIDEVCKKLVPDDVLSRYMSRTMKGPQELWRMRKSFTLQLAAASFMTYALHITQRQPSRFQISRSTGQLFMSELLCGFNPSNALLISTESVPFRLTPNLQHLVGPIGTEALLCPGIVAIARALTKPEYELDQHLCLFIRDEVLTTHNFRAPRSPQAEQLFRSKVQENINGIVNRAETMACKLEKAQDPKDSKITQSMQSVTNLISASTNPIKLANMPDNFQPWF